MATSVEKQASGHLENFVKKLYQLHLLIAANKDDDEAGDNLRDEMDVDWYAMTAEEQELTGGLSGDLYSIHEDRPQPKEVSETALLEVCDAIRRGDWLVALHMLRQHEEHLPADRVACFRGISWGKLLNHYEVEVAFLQRAIALNPRDKSYERALLARLLEAGDLDAALPRAEELVAILEDPWSQLLAANIFLTAAELSAAASSTQFAERAFSALERGIDNLNGRSSDPSLTSYLSYVELHAALVYARYEQRSKAIQTCSRVLLVDPGNINAIELMRWLLDDKLAPAERDAAGQELTKTILQDATTFLSPIAA